MRAALFMALVFLSACASDRLALVPPSGVDLSGHWRLNEADSDDPLRLYQSQTPDPSRVTAGSGGQGQGAPGGRGGRQGGRGGGGFSAAGPLGPSTPGVGALGEGLRWPGKEVDIKQTGGVVNFASGGVSQICRPASSAGKSPHPKSPDSEPRGRDFPSRDRGAVLAPRCGWEDRTLVMQGGEPDDDHPPYDERYSVSEDGQRLIEVVGFKGGRSGGFTMSRVWDRIVPGTQPPRL